MKKTRNEPEVSITEWFAVDWKEQSGKRFGPLKYRVARYEAEKLWYYSAHQHTSTPLATGSSAFAKQFVAVAVADMLNNVLRVTPVKAGGK